MLSRTLSCNACGWRTVDGSGGLAARLRLVGLLRRDGEPGDELIAELLPGAVGRMTCPGCKRIGLRVGVTEGADSEDWDDGWQTAVLCEACRKPIDPERLEALPDTRRCTACQQKSESGVVEEDEPEFCPRCGALLELRVSRSGGLTRYRLFCTGAPPCRLNG